MTHDAIIVGGSFAGLSAATYLGRGRRSVCVLDTGSPRNRFAHHSHGVFGLDGGEPAQMLATARAQVSAYPTVSLVQARAVSARKDPEGFSVTLDDGGSLRARRLVLAYGISDELPKIPGLAERWGHTVIHCPYCHGYEFSGRRLGVLMLSPMSVHQAQLIAEWGPTTLYLNGVTELDPEALHELQRREVAIEPSRVKALHGEGTALSSLELEDGRTSPLEALYIGARTHLNSDLADQLGCALEDGPFGKLVRTDEWKLTSVPGVFAAGDITRPAHSITWATSDGMTAGVAAHRSLVFP